MESFLVVCDADGKNAKTIATEKWRGAAIHTITFGHGQQNNSRNQLDWR